MPPVFTASEIPIVLVLFYDSPRSSKTSFVIAQKVSGPVQKKAPAEAGAFEIETD
jgi:hypothetical protein